MSSFIMQKELFLYFQYNLTYIGIDGETLNVEVFAPANLQKKRQHFYLKKEKHVWILEGKGEMREEKRRWGEESKLQGSWTS